MAHTTKNAIRAAFLSLLEERPLGKITVRDISEKSGINRNSFYYHYQDIPSLLSEIISEVAEDIIASYPDFESLEECLDAAIAYAIKRRRIVKHIFDSVNRDIFEQYLMRVCEQVVSRYLNTTLSSLDLSEYDKASIIRYYKFTVFGFIVDWVSDGMTDEAINQFHNFIRLHRTLSIIDPVNFLSNSDI